MATLDHPLMFDRTWLARTGPVKAFNQAVTNAVQVGLPSLLIQGPSGVGKTATGFELFEHLSNQANKPLIPWRASAIGAHTRADIPRFFRTFEGPDGSANMSALSGFTVVSDLERTANALLLSADEAKCSRILLFIDEAQELEYPVLVAIKGLSEKLQSKRVHLLVLLFAEPDVQHKISSLKAKGTGQSIVQRFFASTYQHRGLLCEDLAVMMKHVDQARFPVDTGPTYTEHFAPQLYKAGWRLASLTGLVWDEFVQTARAMRLDANRFELMPRFAVRALRYMLTQVSQDSTRMRDEPSLVAAAVQRSGFTEAQELERSSSGDSEGRPSPRRQANK